MASPTIDDLEFLFYGGGNDAYYQYLLACYAAGVNAIDILEFIQGGGGGGGGTTIHNNLTGRDVADGHPTGAITGLDTALAGKSPTVHGHAATEVSVVDAGNLYAGANVEAVLQELKALAQGTNITLTPGAGVVTISVDSTWATFAVPLFARATADDTRTNTAAVAADTQLTVNVVANAIYEVSAVVAYDSPNTSDFRLGWVGPAGATMPFWVTGAMHTGTTTNFGDIQGGVVSAIGTSTQAPGAGAGTVLHCTPKGLLVVGATAGAFAFAWAQGTAEATNTIRKAGSYMRLNRVA